MNPLLKSILSENEVKNKEIMDITEARFVTLKETKDEQTITKYGYYVTIRTRSLDAEGQLSDHIVFFSSDDIANHLLSQLKDDIEPFKNKVAEVSAPIPGELSAAPTDSPAPVAKTPIETVADSTVDVSEPTAIPNPDTGKLDGAYYK
jgi:hypothetical protein